MKKSTIALVFAAVSFAAIAAQPVIPASVPVPTALPPGISLPPAPGAALAGLAPTASAPKHKRIDAILEGLATRASAVDAADDQAAEQSTARNLNVLKNGRQAINAIGYSEVGGEAYAYATGENGSMLRIRAGQSYGPVRVASITADGVRYSVGKQQFFAPIAFMHDKEMLKGTQPVQVAQTTQNPLGK